MERKVILITGASSGIGAATAIELSKDYQLVLCGRNEERLHKTKEECYGEDHLILPFDMENVNDIQSMISAFIKQHSLSIYGFVNCAGMIKYVPVKMFSVKEFEKIFAVNVIGPAMLLKVLSSKKFNSDNLKSAVLISSNISNYGAKAHSLYSASKSALDGLMRSAAVELAPRVRVNSVLPGGVETAMTEAIFQDHELVSKMEQAYPLGLGKPKDIATAVKFLISEESGWITGQQLTVDGGRTINLSV